MWKIPKVVQSLQWNYTELVLNILRTFNTFQALIKELDEFNFIFSNMNAFYYLLSFIVQNSVGG